MTVEEGPENAPASALAAADVVAQAVVRILGGERVGEGDRK